MEIELKFSKGGEVTPWGFRLVGGVDFEQPLVVVKVDENSIAEKTGLKVGDIITKINGDCVGELSHSQAQSLIISSGEKISLLVKRGTFIDLPGYINEELSDAEISSILKDQTGNRMLQKTPDQIENLTGQERILTTSTNYNPIRGSKQKYSTFLQKPERAKPVPKKVQEERKILGEPYKVKIVKQKRKFPNSKKVSFEPDVGPSNTTEDTIAESEVSSIQDTESYIEDTNVIAQEDEELKIEEIEEKSDNQDEQNNINEADNEDISIRSASPSSTSEARIEEIPETSLTLEEQLKAVQKQLLALSQLPTSIQATLAAVTQQLDQIVGSKNEDTIEEEDEEENVEEENRNEENDTTSEKSGEISDNEDEATSSISEGRKRHNTEVDQEEPQSEIEQEIQVEEEEKEPEISEEERLAKIREEELLAKKQKVEQLNRSWPWKDEQKPIYSINFLKYTPPPKNLDYLQNSEVYRMVHDLEGPPHGVGSRSEKILSEQDYYQNKFAP